MPSHEELIRNLPNLAETEEQRIEINKLIEDHNDILAEMNRIEKEIDGDKK